MSKGSEIVVYLNDIPITHLSDPLRPSTDNYFSLRAWSQSDSSIVLFKNLKIWNLNNLNQSFTTPQVYTMSMKFNI